MHRLAGAIASLSAAALITFVADANTQPHSLAIPILVVALLVAVLAWWFTKTPKGSASVSASSFKGEAIAAGRDSYNAGRDIKVTTLPSEIDPAQTISEARAELRANRDRIAEAEKEDAYDTRFFLSETKRGRATKALSGTAAWEALDDAYAACERLKRRLERRGQWSLNGDIVEVMPEDDLSKAVSVIDQGITELAHTQL